MSELLNENTVVSYLTARGVISGPAEVEILTGGVSNVVLAIKTNNKAYIVFFNKTITNKCFCEKCYETTNYYYNKK